MLCHFEDIEPAVAVDEVDKPARVDFDVVSLRGGLVAARFRDEPRDLLRRGRVGSAQRTVGLLAAPVGAAGAGLLGSAVGLPPVLYAGTALFALATLTSWLSLGTAGPGRRLMA